ncbi:MAG: SLOG family protein [Clostridia bacterium]|nr:SLOG family protein [Clostridia bacterium]
METKTKVCCVTGHRPKGFPWNYYGGGEEHKEYLAALYGHTERLIERYGYNYFITGCAIGVDLDFAEVCIKLRDTKYPHIFIEGAIPCDGQDAKWSVSDKERYARVLAKLDKVHYVSHTFSMACFQKRNEYMVDRSDIVFAIWNTEKKGGTWNTMQYAIKKMKYVKHLYLGFFSRDEKEQEKANRECFRPLTERETQIARQKLWRDVQDEELMERIMQPPNH